VGDDRRPEPVHVEYLGDVATSIKEQTKTNFPIMQGDAFIDVASRSPLYYDILGIPQRSAKLRAEDPDCGAAGTPPSASRPSSAVDILKNIDEEFENNDDVVARAGFKKSDVSDFNRVVERHLFKNANNRAFWISYDFAGQSGKQNITVNPLDFDFDGGEIIFTLPNGMQGYMLTDAAGNRLNEGPLNIVQDESQKDFLVRNGVSCMGCHSAGMIKVQDDIRYALDENMSETAFDAIERDQIRDLYPRARSSTASSRGHPPLQRLPRPRRRADRRREGARPHVLPRLRRERHPAPRRRRVRPHREGHGPGRRQAQR
jgi:hypothetical protein